MAFGSRPLKRHSAAFLCNTMLCVAALRLAQFLYHPIFLLRQHVAIWVADPLHRPLSAGFFRRMNPMTVSVSNIKASANQAVISGQVAKAVIEARLAAGYSIDDLALTTGLVHDEIVGVEEGADADPAKVRRIAAALRIPPSALLVA
jgi:hypothetical protein